MSRGCWTLISAQILWEKKLNAFVFSSSRSLYIPYISVWSLSTVWIIDFRPWKRDDRIRTMFAMSSQRRTRKNLALEFNITKTEWPRNKVSNSCSGGHEIESRRGRQDSAVSGLFLFQSVTELRWTLNFEHLFIDIISPFLSVYGILVVSKVIIRELAFWCNVVRHFSLALSLSAVMQLGLLVYSLSRQPARSRHQK